MILISWLSINTNARTWGPNGMSYVPERWLPDPKTPDIPADVPHALLAGWQHLSTFSEGPRICLGYRLALFEIKALLLTLVRDFKFDGVDQVPVLAPALVPGSSAGRVLTGEMMDVKIKKTFGGLINPQIIDGDKAGMAGVWLPVKVSAIDDAE